MGDTLTLAGQNLLTPMILSFALGAFAALARSELTVPEAAAKAMSLYLLFAIGFKGGVAVADHGFDGHLLGALAGGVVLSFGLPFVAYGLLRLMTGLSALDAAAVAAHYGSCPVRASHMKAIWSLLPPRWRPLPLSRPFGWRHGRAAVAGWTRSSGTRFC